MVVVLIVGVLLGWKARRASIQRRSVAAIREAGGSVRYDLQNAADPMGNGLPPGAEHWAPAWLRGPIGDEYFQEPEWVFLQLETPSASSRPAHETLEAVARLDHVDELNTLRFPIDDAGFAKLAAMPRLKGVCLLDVAMTDAGLAPIETFPALERLTIRVKAGSPGISAGGLEHVARLPRLKCLEILNTNLDGPSSLAPLAKLTRLESLRLWRSPLDDACLEHLRGLTALETLDLRETRLTDSGVDHLKGMDRLETLRIDCSKLTDAGLDKLAGLAALKDLRLLPASKVTPQGLAAYRKARPGVKVVSGPVEVEPMKKQ